ncbi:MAG: 4'-phosphopantetheinyl transferase superfamily protein [bacterium]|nr:4'-phosphopantetheinyl transferase superfamily protein [bacterium]
MFSTFGKNVFLAVVEDITTDLDLLHPDELLLGERFNSTKRCEDFFRGRIAARRALSVAGCQASFPLLIGESGEPLWPETIAGSISHSSAVAVAAVASKCHMPLLGIDLQTIITIERAVKLLGRIASDSERAWVNADPVNVGLRSTAIFSLKEAAYKMLFPGVTEEEHLRFSDIEIHFEGEHPRFARLERTLAARAEDCYLEGFLSRGAVFPVNLEQRDSLLLSAMWIDNVRVTLAR